MRPTAVLSALLLLLASMLFVTPVPALLVADEPTPGLACRAAAQGLPVPRIVPEPEQALDYISYDEALECFRLINASAPQYFEMYEIGKSAGWPQPTGARTSMPIPMIIITNEESALPFEQKLKNLYVLSIHGNEMGGREGGFRVIEDLARGIGVVEENPALRDYLDFVAAIFVFPNIDGWTHEDPNYAGVNPGTGFTRGNGDGFDLNRQWPNRGWNREQYRSMSQPEMVATVTTLKKMANWAYGTDIHGMANPSDGRPEEVCRPDGNPGGSLLMGMLSAGQSDPRKMLKTTRLAELLKERVDADPSFREWNTAPSTGLWGGNVMYWGTSWDSIGYVDSGFTGDFIFQPHGFNAVDIDFELSYSVSDTHYVPAGMEINRLHTRAVRQVVAVFLEAAATDVRVSYETKGHRTAFLYNPTLVTNRNADGSVDPMGGHAEENPYDDAFDYLHVDYAASPNDYFVDIQPFLRDGDKPGTLDALNVKEIGNSLNRFDTFVIAGSAVDTLRGDATALEAISAWTKSGGNLVLTDQALKLLSSLGVVQEDDVQSLHEYAGFTTFTDPNHALAQGLRGLARQTYEAVPIGYQPGQAPIWYVRNDAWPKDAGRVGEVAAGGAAGNGVPCGVPLLEQAVQAPDGVNLGEIAFGNGRIRVLGALLPDPTEEFYHPYGLDSYATTYTGNLLFRNLVGWEEVYDDPPVVAEEVGRVRAFKPSPSASEALTGVGGGVPMLPFVVSAGLVAIVAAWRRRSGRE